MLATDGNEGGRTRKGRQGKQQGRGWCRRAPPSLSPRPSRCPAAPVALGGTDWLLLAGRRKMPMLTESSAKESNAKCVPRALLTFNYC